MLYLIIKRTFYSIIQIVIFSQQCLWKMPIIMVSWIIMRMIWTLIIHMIGTVGVIKVSLE